MYWMLVPVFLSADKSVSWNLFFGSFLGVVAISFVVSMKGSFVSFKASIFQHNCWNQAPQRQVNKLLSWASIPDIKTEILLSCSHTLTFHILVVWRGVKKIKSINVYHE